jgi:prephenate dehydrogenase
MKPGERALPEELETCRNELDQVDEKLIRLIARRLELGLQAAEIKREAGLPILDPAREAKVLEQARAWARTSNLSEEEVVEIFRRLVSLSGKAQLRAP